MSDNDEIETSVLINSAPVTLTNGNVTTYDADVTFLPSVVDFGAYRTDGTIPNPATIAVSFFSDNPAPGGAAVNVSAGSGNKSKFSVTGVSVSPSQMNGNMILSIDASVPPGIYADQAVPVQLAYDGGTASLNLDASVKVYAPAAPEFLLNNQTLTLLDFGIVHLGDTVAQTIEIANTTSGALTDDLIGASGTIAGTLGTFFTRNDIGSVAAGDAGTIAINFTATGTGAAFVTSSGALFNLASHDSDLADEQLTNVFGPFLEATVYNYAAPIFVNSFVGPTAGSLTQSGNTWTLNLGTITSDTTQLPNANIEIENAVPVLYSDSVGGSLEVLVAGGGPLVQSLNNVALDAPVPGMNFLELGDFTVDPAKPGAFSETIVFHPTDSNSAGFSESLPDMTLNVVGDVVEPLCFLAGTKISTIHGEVAVETLSIGDEVVTLAGAVRRIVWIGRGRVLAARGQRSAATPVIIRKSALADNVPNQDLHLTKAHGIYIDGVFIPVEFLVNHRSILWDDHAREVELHHIELASHDILIANGAPAESYRDDGNRWLFQNASSGWRLPPQEPCAQVLTGGAIVDAAWLRILDRAGGRPGVPLTRDPDLHLLADGLRIDANRRDDGLHMFRLPSRPTNHLHILSRAAAPQELGLARDPRCLGVAIRKIVMWMGVQVRLIEAEDARLTDGFHGFEADNGIRWTNGYAALPMSLFDGVNGAIDIALYLGGTTSYLDQEGEARAA